MTHRHLALLDELDAEGKRMPDDRGNWQHPGAHSNSDDGRLLARIVERTTNIMRQIDDIAETAYKMIDTQNGKIDGLDKRITVLERYWTRALAYAGMLAVVLMLLAPILQAAVKAMLHLP